MRQLLFYICFFTFTANAQSLPDSLPDLPKLEPPKPVARIICMCDIEAQFPGGNSALYKYINEHLDITGFSNEFDQTRAYVQFIVEIDGSLSGIHVVHGGTERFNRRIVQLMKEMPRWIPGEHGCYGNVRTRAILPIEAKFI